MKYICIACNEDGYDTFYNREKALLYLLKLKNDQKDIFISSFDNSQLITDIIMNYKDSNIEIYKNSIYYKEHFLNIFDYYIETDTINYNLLFEFMKKYHKIWCCIDDSENICWINACKFI